MKSVVVLKVVSALVLASFISAAQAASVDESAKCLSASEKTEFLELSQERLKAIADQPKCEKSHGAAGCLSPLRQATFRWYQARSMNCFVSVGSPELLGDWNVVARVCEPSGAPANDAFVIGRDTLKVTFRESGFAGYLYMTTETQIAGQQAYTRRGSVGISTDQMVASLLNPESGRYENHNIQFELTPNPTLIFTTTGFGPGGSCAVGETLKTYLRK